MQGLLHKGFLVTVTAGAILSWQGGFMQRSTSRPLGADPFSIPNCFKYGINVIDVGPALQ